jgi:hypothetical protein
MMAGGSARGWLCAGLLGASLLGPRPGPARAELLEVRQVAAGMECPECARGLRLLVKELDGVDDAATSWNRRILTVQFHPGNHATLDQIRGLVVKQHFVVREAEVVVAGTLAVTPEGAPTLVVPESGARYRLTAGSPKVEAWFRSLGRRGVTRVVVTGRVPPPTAGAGGATGTSTSLLAATDIRDG